MRVDIKWYEGIYEINRLWEIRSYWKRIGQRSNIVEENPKIIKWRTKPQGERKYLMQTLFTQDWISKHYKTARLVAQTFLWIDWNNASICVTYKDGDYKNCAVNNLKVCEKKEITRFGPKGNPQYHNKVT